VGPVNHQSMYTEYPLFFYGVTHSVHYFEKTVAVKYNRVCASLHFHVTHVITLCFTKVRTLLCHNYGVFLP
jgi:hypothetical protein